MASSAGTSRRMVISLEKTLAKRDTQILSLKDSVKSTEEKLNTIEDKIHQSFD